MTEQTVNGHEHCIRWPEWMVDELSMMSDAQIAAHVKLELELRFMMRRCDEQEREVRERWWQVYRSRPFLQRLKMRIGW